MQSIEYNKENLPILNQIYDILAELASKRSHCAKYLRTRKRRKAIDYHLQTTTSPSGWKETPNGKEKGKMVLLSYTASSHTSKSEKCSQQL